MKNTKINYKYLLYLYSRVDQYLSGEQNHQENLPDSIVSFCIVVEKILKIKLHKKNPVLVFDYVKFKEEDALFAIIGEKENSIETLKIENILNRFKNIFKNIFSEDEIQALVDIYKVRNHFVHGYKPDNKIIFSEDDIVKKMGTIWQKISRQAINLFGKDNIKAGKPQKMYSEKELENVLINEVKTKIKSTEKFYYYLNDGQPSEIDCFLGREKCPRCGSYGFSKNNLELDSDVLSMNHINRFSTSFFSNLSLLYKCKKCHLELTEKEYEIAKKIKK